MDLCILFSPLKRKKCLSLFFPEIFHDFLKGYFILPNGKRGMHVLPQAGKILFVFLGFFGEEKKEESTMACCPENGILQWGLVGGKMFGWSIFW